LSWLGIELDPELNEAQTSERERPISTENSRPKIFVIPTNEELLIARDTARLILKNDPRQQ
jgi:acetate kinase